MNGRHKVTITTFPNIYPEPGPIFIYRHAGYMAAMKGDGILSNPHPDKSPQFNHWVDGWCQFHSVRP